MTVRGVNADNVQALIGAMKPHYPMAICRAFDQSGESRACPASQKAAIKSLTEALSGCLDDAVRQRLTDRVLAIGEGSWASPDSENEAIGILRAALGQSSDELEQNDIVSRIVGIGAGSAPGAASLEVALEFFVAADSARLSHIAATIGEIKMDRLRGVQARKSLEQAREAVRQAGREQASPPVDLSGLERSKKGLAWTLEEVQRRLATHVFSERFLVVTFICVLACWWRSRCLWQDTYIWEQRSRGSSCKKICNAINTRRSAAMKRTSMHAVYCRYKVLTTYVEKVLLDLDLP